MLILIENSSNNCNKTKEAIISTIILIKTLRIVNLISNKNIEKI